MEYRRFGNKIVLRLEKGEEVCESLLKLAEEENIRLAAVSGIGASNDVTLGIFETEKKQYFKKRYADSDYEIASLSGNLTRQEGRPYLHLHAVIGNPMSRDWRPSVTDETHAGHLTAALISATGEIVVDVIDGEVGRKFSETVGLNLFEF